MSRSPLDDELLSHEFHILDVGFRPPFNPPFALWPAAGFSSISSPSVSLEMDRTVEGTSDYTYPVASGKATVDPITLSKGVLMFNTDFWKWVSGSIAGKSDSTLGLTSTLSIIPAARRRNLLLMQSSGLSFDGISEIIRTGSIKSRMRASALAPVAGIAAGLSAASSFVSQGVADLNMLSVPGRAYMLFDCMPKSYKTGTDFDANSLAVSIETLEIEYTRFELFGPAMLPEIVPL